MLAVALLMGAILIQSTPSISTSSAVKIPLLGGGTGNNPTLVVLWATPSGWSADWSINLNPTFNEFRGVSFSVNASWSDLTAGGGTYDFAVYTAGFPAASVSTQNNCSPGNTNGCLARSLTISPVLHFAYAVLTPNIPKDDFTGPGQYEYFDEYHPTIGHGTINVFKSPDLNSDGTVDIGDIATMALAWKSSAQPTPTPTWNPNADLDNDGIVNISDLAIAALYYKTPA